MGPGVLENDRGGAIRVLQVFRQPKNSSTLFKYILLYIPGRGLLHDMGTLHLLHPRCCDRSLRGKGVGMAASSCGTPQVKCQVLTSVFSPSLHGAMPGVNHAPRQT